MVRSCAVQNCKNVDTEILCHRFPKSADNFNKWIENLKISTDEITEDDLAKKFVVCTIHFDKNDYTNKLSNKLNTTAIPKLYGHIPRVSPQILSPADDIVQCNEDDSETDQFKFELSPDTEMSDSHEILNISMNSSILMFDISNISENKNEPKDNYDDELYHVKNETYESDVEVIEFDHVMSSNSNNISETVSLISSGENTSPVYFDYIAKTYAECSCQVNTEELNKNGHSYQTNEIEDSEFQNLERKQLIDLIKKQKTKIFEMDIKLKEFQKAHSKLVDSMEAFQLLITNDNSEDEQTEETKTIQNLVKEPESI